MEGMELIIGALLPVVLEFIFKWVGERDKLKFVLSVIIPLLIGGGLSYSQLNVVDPEAVLASGAIIFTAAQGVYKLYFRDSGVQRKIASL